jgi:hypothetical protein
VPKTYPRGKSFTPGTGGTTSRNDRGVRSTETPHRAGRSAYGSGAVEMVGGHGQNSSRRPAGRRPHSFRISAPPPRIDEFGQRLSRPDPGSHLPRYSQKVDAVLLLVGKSSQG